MNVPQHEIKAAQKAYEAYCNYTGGKSPVTGDKLPAWANLPANIKNAWHTAAKAASEVYIEAKTLRELLKREDAR